MPTTVTYLRLIPVVSPEPTSYAVRLSDNRQSVVLEGFQFMDLTLPAKEFYPRLKAVASRNETARVILEQAEWPILVNGEPMQEEP